MFAVSLGVCLSSLCRNRGVLRYLKNASMFGHFLRGVGRYGNSGPLLYVYVWTSHIVYCFHHFSDGPRPFVWPVQLWRQTHFNSADVETLPPHTACCVVFPTEDPPGIAGILPGLVGLHTKHGNFKPARQPFLRVLPPTLRRCRARKSSKAPLVCPRLLSPATRFTRVPVAPVRARLRKV